MTELRLPWMPEGRLVWVEGRGELFARIHRHPDPDAPVVLLLHGWTASSDLQFFTAYEALAERCSFIGVDHRGHGRGLRSPDAFTLEDAADDAAAVVRALRVGPVIAVGYSMGGPVALHLARRHRDVVAGIVVQATAMEWSETWRERALWRVLPMAGSWLRSRGYRRYLNRAVPKLIGAEGAGRARERQRAERRWGLGAQPPEGYGVDHPIEVYVPWLLSEMSRNDAFAMVDAGRALSRYDARPWASTLGVPAGSLITTKDRLVAPRKQWALARALGATVRELPADHLAALADPVPFAALTVELVGLVAAAQPAPNAAVSPSPAAVSSR